MGCFCDTQDPQPGADTVSGGQGDRMAHVTATKGGPGKSAERKANGRVSRRQEDAAEIEKGLKEVKEEKAAEAVV